MSRSARRVWTLRQSVLAAVGALAVVAGVLIPFAPTHSAHAATASDWDPGYIIDDAVFYDSSAMSATEIQTFLDSRVAACAPGATCLKSYGQATTTIAPDRYCDGFTGSSWHTASQIIDQVARSCGISQRVLLVLLEKEQSLVTSRSPSSWSYSAATGQSCPDTAPCDPRYSGFFYQVYYAARQFEVYRLNPTSFGYRAGRWNNILYSPNLSCGTRSVFIANQATAALYIYTPYTPNAASLANLYGTGDACSTYGNRNFWRLFTDWFGNPRSYTVLDGFRPFYDAQGGASGPIGSPVSYAVYIEQNGQGWYQRFTGGTLYGSYQGGTVFVPAGAILTEYLQQGGPAGPVGWPNGIQGCHAGRCEQSFVSASLTSTAAYGGQTIWGGMRDYWVALGGLSGPLGAAVGAMSYQTPAAGVAWVQNFEAGVFVQSGQGFVLVPYSSVQRAWSASGGGAGPLGWPSSEHVCRSSGCAQTFTGGIVTSHSFYGAHVIDGDFTDDWTDHGGLEGIGPALNDSSSSAGGRVQNFAQGILSASSSGTFLVPYGPIQREWSDARAQSGWYGWPSGEQLCNFGACAQEFQGAILSTSSWGTFSTFGSLAAAWKSAGGTAGYGPALNSIRFGSVSGGAWSQHYLTGVLTQRVGEQPVFSPYGPIIDMWYHYGAENTWLGWPVAAPVCEGALCSQQFQRGVARTDGRAVSFTSD